MEFLTKWAMTPAVQKSLATQLALTKGEPASLTHKSAWLLLNMRHLLFCLLTAYQNFASAGVDPRTDLPTALFGAIVWLLDLLADIIDELVLHALEVDQGVDPEVIAKEMSA
jgi:hypothetical protein